MDLTFTCVSKRSELEQFRSEWNDVIEKSDADKLFMSFDWVTTWAEHNAGASELLVYIVRRGTDPVGIIPLVRRRKEGFRELVLVGISRSDYLDFILDPVHAYDCVQCFVERILPDVGGWDVFHCSRLIEENQTCTQLLKVLKEGSRYRHESTNADIAPFVRTDGDWNAYAKNRLRRYKSIKYQKRRLGREIGEPELMLATTEAEVREWFAHLVEHHKVRREDVKSDYSMFNNQNVSDFYLNAALRALENGALHFSALKVGTEILGLQLNFLAGKRFYYLIPVFNWAYSKYSVGNMHTAEVLRCCFQNGCHTFDMGYGGEVYKNDYAFEKRTLIEVVIANDTMLGRAAFYWFYRARSVLRESSIVMDSVLPKLKSVGLVKEGA